MKAKVWEQYALFMLSFSHHISIQSGASEYIF